jgi:hypothetical protein
MDKQLAKRLLPLVNNNQTWEPLKEFLQEQILLTQQALVVAQSEQELRQLQGKAASLGMLLQLQDRVRAEAKRDENT